MRDLTKRIIAEFNESFYPQEISMAEVAVSRFVAGDGVEFLAEDYKKSAKDIHRAIRFFLLMARGNKTIRKVYDEHQESRWVKK